MQQRDGTIAQLFSAGFLTNQVTGQRLSRTVAEIQRSDRVHWQHVPTEDNPADAAPPGVEPSELKNLEYWWKKSNWLRSRMLPSQPN